MPYLLQLTSTAGTFAENKKVIHRLLKDAIQYFKKNIFKPLPCKIFPASQQQEAFHYMAKAMHIGKVMLKIEQENVSALPIRSQNPLFDSNSTYLVTGGLSGFGMATAQWIVKMGDVICS